MPKRQHIGRRRFLAQVPAAVAAGLAVPARRRPIAPVETDAVPSVSDTLQAPRQDEGRPPDAPPDPGITRETLEAAQTIIGLQFTDAETDLAVPAVAENLERFTRLRQVTVPLDTEPAFAFHPAARSRRPHGRATPNAPLRVAHRAPARVPADPDQLAFEPVTVLAELLRRRAVTSSDLTRLYLTRLKKYGDPLRCVITLTEELALEQAARADRELARGRYRGPLHGIPWGAKDLFATRGIRTTWGARPFEHQMIDIDATVVERLRNAGAVLVAKLSMGALAQGGVWFGGTTRNPWNPQTGSSGSSAGPAAATAAGLVGFSIGTETRGSIMTPASLCGVVGLRPTYGRVSRYGAMALSWTMDKIGPMCRSVEDCALVFNAIYGPDGRDETVADAPFHWNRSTPLRRFRIGYIESELLSHPLMQDSLEVFRSLGARVEPMELPEFPADAIGFILQAEAAAAFDDLTRSRGIDELPEQGPFDWPNTFRASRFIPAVEYLRAQRARTRLMREMEALMTRFDAFLAPARGSASLPLTNLTGHPAVCLKNGFAGGLPQGLMITGRLYEEATILRIALAFERATPWRTMHPSLQGLAD